MKRGLDDLLGNRSIEELRQLAAAAQQKATQLDLAKARESLTAIVDAKIQRIVNIGDPRKVRDFEKYLSNYRASRRGGRRVSEERTPWGVFDERRPRIKELIYALGDKYPEILSRGVSAQYCLDNIPELKKDCLVKNARALSGYFRSIMQDPGSRLKRKSKGLYIVSPALTREDVYRQADAIYKKQKFVSYPDISGNPKTIGRYLALWAQERGMESEAVSMGRAHHQVTLYFKGKRPPVTPTERIKAFVGGKKRVTHTAISRATGLEDKAILSSMTGHLEYNTEGQGPNRVYIR